MSRETLEIQLRIGEVLNQMLNDLAYVSPLDERTVAGARADIKQACIEHILALEGDGWRLAVIYTQGELPSYPKSKSPKEYAMLMNTHREQYELAQQDMRNSGWVKEVKPR